MTTPGIISTERPCPSCGYDLRATAADRCPECGTAFKHTIPSRIPWMNRRHHSPILTYLQTCWMFYRHPVMLARESNRWLPLHSPRRFHRITLALATLLGTALAALVHFLRSYDLIELIRINQSGDENGNYVPLRAFDESYWILLPFSLFLFIFFIVATSFFRHTAAAFAGKRRIRRRINHVAYFTSAQLIPITLLAGTFGIALMLYQADTPIAHGKFQTPLQYLCIALPLFTLLMFEIYAILFISGAGDRREPRALLMLLVYPPIISLAALSLLLITFWTIGYIWLVIRSMTL